MTQENRRSDRGAGTCRTLVRSRRPLPWRDVDRHGRSFGIASLIVLLCGCAHRAAQPALPQHRWTDASTALRTLAERARAVRSVQSEGSITLTRPDTGESVRLDGAIALEPPDRARLRAWKIGQAVFDLTINPDGAWAVLPEGHRDEMRPAGQNASRFLRQWSTYLGDFFAQEGLTVDDRRGGPRFTVSRKAGDGTLACDVERTTLTPRVYRFVDADGRTRFTLLLNEYRAVKGVPFPTELVAKGDGVGQVRVRLVGVELNEEIAPKAFVPPKRAEKLP